MRRHTRGGKRWIPDENNEGRLLLGMVEKKGYCRYEGENIQRCLEGSRLNMTSRIDQDVGCGGCERRDGDQGAREVQEQTAMSRKGSRSLTPEREWFGGRSHCY